MLRLMLDAVFDERAFSGPQVMKLCGDVRQCRSGGVDGEGMPCEALRHELPDKLIALLGQVLLFTISP
jgi:hypothetical protein